MAASLAVALMFVAIGTMSFSANSAAVSAPGSVWGSVTSRVSVSSSGEQGAFGSAASTPAISADGRFAVFSSPSSNLAPGDANFEYDVFVRDRATAVTQLVSVGLDGQAGGDSLAATISASGRFVAFESFASGLTTPCCSNGHRNVYVRDMVSGVTQKVSVGLQGQQVAGDSSGSVISGNGRFVVFTSIAPDLVAGDTNGLFDVFVRDLETGVTQRVSVGPSGQQAVGGGSFGQSISRDGRFVAITSDASNLVPGDTNGLRDIFVRDLVTGLTQRVSVHPNGSQITGATSAGAALSANGRFVAFDSLASGLVAGDTNGVFDVFVRDLEAGVTQRVSVSVDGRDGDQPSVAPSLSARGRFVAFVSDASNLVAGDTNGLGDVFVRDLVSGVTQRVSVHPNGTQITGAPSRDATISANGRAVAFDSFASGLVAGDTNGVQDVFVRDR